MDNHIKKIYNAYNGVGIVDDGGYVSKEFKDFASMVKTQLKASAESRGFSLDSFNAGHYFVSGFFRKNEKYVYFSYDVPRGEYPINFDACDPMNGWLFRTAEGNKDFTGGTNHFSSLPDLMDSVGSILV